MAQEINKLRYFVAQFTSQDMEEKYSNIVRVGRNFYYINDDLRNLRTEIQRDVYSLGIFLGEEKERFYPSPALVELISKIPDAEKRKVYINKKAEWLFLCGRNVLPESISKNPNHLQEGLVLIQNEGDENLGYGEFKKEDKLIIRNLLDKGRYLRLDEKGRKKR